MKDKVEGLYPLALKLHQGFLSYETESCSGMMHVLIGCDNNAKENKKLMTFGKRRNHFHSTTSTH